MEAPGAVRLESDAPNQIWPADFKGQFKTRDGRYCYPLTVTDHYSRMLLLCKGLPSVRTEGAKPAFERLFREVGLPDAIRTDNGAPFASTGIHGLCELNVWWMQLGIVHQRIRPSSPQENGQHERMHKDLKRETTRPPAENLAGAAAEVRSLPARATTRSARMRDRWRLPVRAVGALGKAVPGRASGGPSTRRHFEVRKVSAAGTFRLKAGPVLPEQRAGGGEHRPRRGRR